MPSFWLVHLAAHILYAFICKAHYVFLTDKKIIAPSASIFSYCRSLFYFNWWISMHGIPMVWAIVLPYGSKIQQLQNHCESCTWQFYQSSTFYFWIHVKHFLNMRILHAE